jgi:branched-chain amino acid transport system ATP-binding protein
VDFQVMPGGAEGIVGPNGAGKTTLFGALAGSHPVTSGQIRLQGRDLTGTSAAPVSGHDIGLDRAYPACAVLGGDMAGL